MMGRKVILLGGGPSAARIDFRRMAATGVDVIGVNKAFLSGVRLASWVTMDYTFFAKLTTPERGKFEKARFPKFFIANFGSGKLIHEGGRITDPRSSMVYDLKGMDVVVKSTDPRPGLGDSWTDFRCMGNSGGCALQLAVLLGYDTVYLVGYDYRVEGDKTHFHDGYGQDPAEFARTLGGYRKAWAFASRDLKRMGVRVYSCSPISSLNRYFPVLTPARLYKIKP